MDLKIYKKTHLCADRETRGGGGTGGPDPYPLENHKAIGFLGNTGPDSLANHKATKPAFNVGPAKRQIGFDGVNEVSI